MRARHANQAPTSATRALRPRNTTKQAPPTIPSFQIESSVGEPCCMTFRANGFSSTIPMPCRYVRVNRRSKALMARMATKSMTIRRVRGSAGGSQPSLLRYPSQSQAQILWEGEQHARSTGILNSSIASSVGYVRPGLVPEPRLSPPEGSGWDQGERMDDLGGSECAGGTT